MNITCNGEQKTVDNDISLNDLVLSLELNPQSLVAEVNGKIIEQPQFSDKKLQDGDRIELIRFVGGG
jgi:sulfur carrier protein